MELKSIIEAILFAAQKALTPKEIREVLKEALHHDEEGGPAKDFKKVPMDKIISALEDLAEEHEKAARTYRLVGVAGSWQFVSLPEYAPWLKALVGHKSRPPRLSQPALETMAIIAYRQPITRAEMEQVRGVAVDGVLSTLVDRGLVEQVGRADTPGRPMRYGSTSLFLEYFGLKDLEELPAADELRRLPITKPESLLTVDPGLETSPDENSEQTGETEKDKETESTTDPQDADNADESRQETTTEEVDPTKVSHEEVDEDDELDDEEEYDDEEDDDDEGDFEEIEESDSEKSSHPQSTS